jgi:Flp pilus assembly protein TadG
MKAPTKSLKARSLFHFLSNDLGQTSVLVALMLPALMGMAALSLDVGHAYVGQRELQEATNAAALAGAAKMTGSGSSSAVSTADSYSAQTGDSNAHPDLTNVSMVSGYPQATCLNALQPSGVACTSSSPANAMVVQQQATIKMFFAGFLGKPTLTLTATAKAAMGGVGVSQYNVAIIVDTTGSMTSTDSGSGSDCNNTRIYCSLEGVRVLLNTLSPCTYGLSTCGTVTSGNVPNPFDRVALFTFPNLATPSQAASDYTCPTTNPLTTSYSFPIAGASSYAPSATTASYQVVGFSSDYRTSDGASSLNAASDIVVAAGGKSGCNGMGAPGGAGTYYAGVIYAAQSALTAQAAANAGTKNVLIILSDGDASSTNMNILDSNYNKNPGYYPSNTYQCRQAVTAAQAATTAGTLVYSVAYGSGASGCSTDAGLYNPCSTMKAMASTSQDFFSDYTATGGDTSCTSAAQPTTNLNEIFTAIANSLTTARLIPNSTT